MKHTWFTMKANAAQDSGDISLHDAIGVWGITAADFIREFKALGGSKINLSINSPGGHVFDGIAIYNTLKHSGKEINVDVIGMAASAASLVAMAASPGKLRMPANSFMMIHDPRGGVMGTAEEMRDMAEVLDKIHASVANTYSARSGQSLEEIEKMLSKDTVMSAAEAVELGFADEVTGEKRVTASFDVDSLPDTIKAAYMSAQKVVAPVEPVVERPYDSAHIEAAAKAAGFEQFAMAWALDETMYEQSALEAQLALAKETKLLCMLCKRPEATDLFIEAKTPLKEVRAKLQDSLASKDESQTIDTALKITNPQNPAAPKAPSMVLDSAYVDSVYASRKANRS